MLRAFGQAFKTPDLRRKLLFTLFIIVLFRLGSFVPAPGVDYAQVQVGLGVLQSNAGATGVFDLINVFSGGALLQVSVFALGIMPYITASIITQLLRVVIPKFQQLWDEGQQGRAQLTQYTRYLTIALALLNATTLVMLVRSGTLFGNQELRVIPDESIVQTLLIIITLTAGTSLIMWMAELITEHGVGNGMSLLIFTSIAASFPVSMGAILQAQGGIFTFLIIIAVGVAVIFLVVFVEQSQRRIPVQYAKRMVGRQTIDGTSTYIPIKINMAGVVPVIFASSILFVPSLLAQFNMPGPGEEIPGWVEWVNNNFVRGDHPVYMGTFFLMIVFFTYFYVGITFNPDEVADNMKQSNGFIPGIRAGKPTSDYLRYVLNRINFPGAIYLGIVALIPLIALVIVGANQDFPFGGTSILIMVGVGLETVKQVDAQLQQRHYEGLLR